MPADRPPEWCNINATYLRQIEDDAKTHSLPVFIDIRKALHVSLDDLLRDELGENEISKIHEIEMLWRVSTAKTRAFTQNDKGGSEVSREIKQPGSSETG